MTKLVTLRYVGPIEFLDVPILGRQGLAPEHAFCADCEGGTAPDDHEHELVGEHAPGTGPLAHGEEFETTEEIAERLLEQVGNFEAVDTGGPSSSWRKAELEAYANDHGIDLAGATTKGEILAAIEKG